MAFQTPPAGKVRVVGIDGHPAWADIPPPTHDELVAQAEFTRSSLLDEANGVTADWRTELALSIISDGDKVKLIAWMEYIKALKAVDTSTVPNISWPAPPEA
ncbi:tail fiber assembly protein [Edwardsiella tarda]|uniref:tail fiber assembly protein n=1 Tax=Edwardsiella tarda TaxID=636 RepID=UPI0011158078|nr:tail fiber assembly protein [Edwardsiella tarda]